MTSLQILKRVPKRNEMIEFCVLLLETEIKKQSGFSGMAVRAGISMIKTVQPQFIKKSVNVLFDDLILQLEPFYQDYQKSLPKKNAFGTYLTQNAPSVSEAFLKITDEKIKKTKNSLFQKVYLKLRSSAPKHISEALNPLGNFVEDQLAK